MLVRFHAASRDLAGCREWRVEGAPPSNVADLRLLLSEHFGRLAPLLNRMRFAVDENFAEDVTALSAECVVDVLPPVAGGAPPLVAVRDTPVEISEVYAAVCGPEIGGVDVFVGLVRNHADGNPVGRLVYEAHPTMSVAEMRRIVEFTQEEMPGVRIAAVHRIGTLSVGDVAVVVAAGAAHRAEAFKACRLVIDRIKETVPIWKHEFAPDSTTGVWVNLEP